MTKEDRLAALLAQPEREVETRNHIPGLLESVKPWICPHCGESTPFVLAQVFTFGAAYECPHCAVGSSQEGWQDANPGRVDIPLILSE